VRIALTYAALNDLQVKVGDVLNAYITAPITEKVWTVLGPEFGQDAGKKAIIVRALYGLKSAGAAFRAHLASFMRTMGYKSCKADPDLWLKEETRPNDNLRYYSYILCYVDDILVINHDSISVLNRINEYLPHLQDDDAQTLSRTIFADRCPHILREQIERQALLLPRVGILNRKSSRILINAQQILNHLNATSIHGHYTVSESPIYFEKADFQEQIEFFASHDIILTPYGAQITGVAFMPMCGQLMEIFPHSIRCSNHGSGLYAHVWSTYGDLPAWLSRS
jgi:hypothetical protein